MPIPGVELGAAQRDAILAHARREAPFECCGLLLGTGALVLDAVAARNVEANPTTRYRIDPRDHLAAIRLARARGLEVVGAYHSHPQSPPCPSETDLTEAWGDFLYLIASLKPGEGSAPLRAWCLDGGNFVEVSLVTPAEEVSDHPCAPDSPSSSPSRS